MLEVECIVFISFMIAEQKHSLASRDSIRKSPSFDMCLPCAWGFCCFVSLHLQGMTCYEFCLLLSHLVQANINSLKTCCARHIRFVYGIDDRCAEVGKVVFCEVAVALFFKRARGQGTNCTYEPPAVKINLIYCGQFFES